MKDKPKDRSFFKDVLEGIRKASIKMAEKSAANNEDLVIGDENGKPIYVPAKDLLKKL